jgi:adenylylsulfate kinase-like enzyme
VDLGQDETNRHAIQLGDSAALVVHFDDTPSQLTAKKLRDEVLAAQPLDGLDRNTLKQALKKLGWDVSSASSDTEDGVTTTNVYADKGEHDVTLVAFDFRAAKREDRMAIGAGRFMNVFVCQDCTKRKEGLLADMTHRRRARKLLAKLTKP